MNTQTILRGLKRHVNGYLTNVGRINTQAPNKFTVKMVYPTDEQFQDFIFKTMQNMGLHVFYDQDSPYRIMYLIKDGFKMPVITHFDKYTISVWINEGVKEPVP